MRWIALSALALTALPAAARAQPCDTSRRSGSDLGVFEVLALDGAPAEYGAGLEVLLVSAALRTWEPSRRRVSNNHVRQGSSRTSDSEPFSDSEPEIINCVPGLALSMGFGARLAWFPSVSFLSVHGLLEQTFRLRRAGQLSLQTRIGVFAARSTHGVEPAPESRLSWGPQLGQALELRYFVSEARLYVGLRAEVRIGIEWVRPVDATPLTFIAFMLGPGLGGTW